MHHFWYQDVDLAQTLQARSFFQRAADLDPRFVRAAPAMRSSRYRSQYGSTHSVTRFT
jgi:hypothetical protein